MVMKKVLMISAVLLAIIISVLAVKTMLVPEKPAHYHANFGVYENGQVLDYSEAKYMDLKPCTVDQKDPLLNDKMENIHLHNLEGKTVHIHQDGVSWNDVLNKLKYDYNSKKDLHVFLDKKKVDSSELKKVIGNDQTLFIHMGALDNDNIDENPTLKAEYDAIGKKSVFYNSTKSPAENCGGVEKRTLPQRFKVALLKW